MTPDKTIDKCKFCGREITYNQEDGYWDSFEKQVGTTKHYTPFCDKREEGYTHEPINHQSDKKGYYHPTLEALQKYLDNTPHEKINDLINDVNDIDKD